MSTVMFAMSRAGEPEVLAIGVMEVEDGRVISSRNVMPDEEEFPTLLAHLEAQT